MIEARVRSRPEFELDDWADVIRRGFASRWWDKNDNQWPRAPPTPAVIFKSDRQVAALMAISDEAVSDAEWLRERSSPAPVDPSSVPCIGCDDEHDPWEINSEGWCRNCTGDF